MFGDSIIVQIAFFIMFALLYFKFLFEHPLKLFFYLSSTYAALTIILNIFRAVSGKELMFFGFSNSMILMTLVLTGFVLMFSKEANPSDEESDKNE